MTPTAVTFQLLLAFMVVNYADKAPVVGASLVNLDVRDWPADQLMVGDVARVASGELDVEDSAVIGNLTSLIKPGGPWRTVEQVEIATLEYVDWFNHRRLFEACGDIPPAELEAAHYRQHTALTEAGCSTL